MKYPLQVEVAFFLNKKWTENDQNGECTILCRLRARKKTPIFEVQETFESIWNPSLLDGRFGPFSRAVENKTIAIFLRQEVNPTAITEKEAPS